MEQRSDVWTIVAAGDAICLPVRGRRAGIQQATAALTALSAGTTVLAHRPRLSPLGPLRAAMERAGYEVSALAVMPSARRPLIVTGLSGEPMAYTANMLLAAPPGSGRPEWFWAFALWVVRTHMGIRLLRRFAPRVLMGRQS